MRFVKNLQLVPALLIFLSFSFACTPAPHIKPSTSLEQSEGISLLPSVDEVMQESSVKQVSDYWNVDNVDISEIDTSEMFSKKDKGE